MHDIHTRLTVRVVALSCICHVKDATEEQHFIAKANSKSNESVAANVHGDADGALYVDPGASCHVSPPAPHHKG